MKFQHIHYRGSAPAVQDLVAGNVEVAFDNIGAAGALIKGRQDQGARRRDREAGAVDAERADGAGDRAGFVVVTWFAIVAPPKTPQAIVAKLNADINEALRDPDVQAAAREPVGRGGGRHARGDRGLLQGRDRDLAQRHQGRQRQAATDIGGRAVGAQIACGHWWRGAGAL